jgi:phosphatidylglycerol:prolipoprotein diacylglycerol transferase
MNPDLFRPLWWWLGVNGPDSYTAFEWLSLLTSVPLALMAARRVGLAWGRFSVLCALTYLTALVTSKAAWLVTVTPEGFVREGVAEHGLLRFLGRVFIPPWTGGQVFYGSVLGVGLAALVFGPLVYRAAWGQTALRYLDVTLVPLVTISAVGRVGCHFAGCCFGREVPGWLGLSYPPMSEPVHHFVAHGLLPSLWMESPPLLPTQLLEAGTSAVLAVLLVRWLTRGWAPGLVALGGLSVHAAIRFLIEFVRFDVRGGLGPLSTSQWLGLAAVAALALVVWRRRRLPMPDSPMAARGAVRPPSGGAEPLTPFDRATGPSA